MKGTTPAWPVPAPRGLRTGELQPLPVARTPIALGYLFQGAIPPAAARELDTPAASGVDRIALRCVGVTLFSEIFLQKVAIPLSHTTQISVTLIIGFMALGFLVLSGRAVVDSARFSFFAL